jgi:hypothetical protein
MSQMAGTIANLPFDLLFKAIDLDSAQDCAIVDIIKLQTRRTDIVENTRLLRPQHSFVLSNGT